MTDDNLDGDPDVEALKPKVGKPALIAAVICGALFGLSLAIASYVFEQYMPRTGLGQLPDAGPTEVPDVVGLDAGEVGASPWLEDE